MSFQCVDERDVAGLDGRHGEGTESTPPPFLCVPEEHSAYRWLSKCPNFTGFAAEVDSDASTTGSPCRSPCRSPRRACDGLLDFDTDSSVAGSRAGSPCKFTEHASPRFYSPSRRDHLPSLKDNVACHWAPELPGTAGCVRQGPKVAPPCINTAPAPEQLRKRTWQQQKRSLNQKKAQGQQQARAAQPVAATACDAGEGAAACGGALPRLWSSPAGLQPAPWCVAAAQTSQAPLRGRALPTAQSQKDLGPQASAKPGLEPKAPRPAGGDADLGADAAADATPLQETRPMWHKSWEVNDFKVLTTVGTGFMGSVRVVKLNNSEDRTPFALKIMKKSQVIQHKQVEHVMSERRILGAISHPFVVKLVTSFQDNARLFMLMEFVNGGELFSIIRKAGRLLPDPAKFYASEITLALAHLHSQDICYRDLKPENVLIDCKGHTKITDFGFAKVVKHQTWTLCGTPEYIAPEIITSMGHGKAVDWWAFGVLIFEMLTGVAPFTGQNSSDIYQKVLTTEVMYPSFLSWDAADLIGGLLTKDKSQRLGSSGGGADDVKGHVWFRIVEWDKMLRRKYAPPFMPDVKSRSDTSRFDRYPEESIEADAGAVSAQEQELFRGYSGN